MYINKAIIYGNLTRDPELKSLPSGMQVVEFGVATNRTWKDKNGAKQESSEFHNIVAFSKQAELVAKYLKKGQPIFVEGRIQTRSWEAKDGSGKRYRTEIVVDNFQFGPKGTSGASSQAPEVGSNAVTDRSKEDTIEYPEEEVNVDDIPF